MSALTACSPTKEKEARPPRPRFSTASSSARPRAHGRPRVPVAVVNPRRSTGTTRSDLQADRQRRLPALIPSAACVFELVGPSACRRGVGSHRTRRSEHRARPADPAPVGAGFGSITDRRPEPASPPTGRGPTASGTSSRRTARRAHVRRPWSPDRPKDNVAVVSSTGAVLHQDRRRARIRMTRAYGCREVSSLTTAHRTHANATVVPQAEACRSRRGGAFRTSTGNSSLRSTRQVRLRTGWHSEGAFRGHAAGRQRDDLLPSLYPALPSGRRRLRRSGASPDPRSTAHAGIARRIPRGDDLNGSRDACRRAAALHPRRGDAEAIRSPSSFRYRVIARTGSALRRFAGSLRRRGAYSAQSVAAGSWNEATDAARDTVAERSVAG